MNRTNFALILLLSLTVLASGCLDGQQEVTGVVETLPEVQEFLDDNPDASIDAVRWNSDYIDDNFDDIKETCQPAIDTEKDHYRVKVEDDSETIVTWLEAEEMEVMCVTREGSETTSEEETSEEIEDVRSCEEARAEITTVDEDTGETTISQTAGQKGVGAIIITWYSDEGNHIHQELRVLGAEDSTDTDYDLQELEENPRSSIQVEPGQDIRDFGSIGIETLSCDEHQAQGWRQEDTDLDTEREIVEVVIDEERVEPSRPEISTEDGVEFINSLGFDIELDFDRNDYDSITIKDGESRFKDFQEVTYYQITPVEDDIEYRTPGGTGVNVVDSVEQEEQDITEEDIEGEIIEVVFEDQGANPSRPDISPEDSIEFVNQEAFELEIEFDRDDYETVTLAPAESKTIDFERIVFYELSPVDDSVEYRTPGGLGVNVQ